jgi:DNA-binding HxlR family transcriptional regulator
VAEEAITCLILVTSFIVNCIYNRGMPKRYGQACPVAKSLEFLGERWTLLVIRDLLSGPRRFHDLQASLEGIAPNVLSERLKVLEDHGVVARQFYSEHPPRAEYTLTPRGRELGVVVGALAAWGGKHLHPDAGLAHDDCDGTLQVRYYCPKCDTRVRGSAVRLRTGARSTGRSTPAPAR